MFHNIAIGRRLALGFAVTILLGILIAAIAIWRMHDVSQATHAMMDSPLAKERLLSDWYSKIDSAVRRTSAIAKSSDPSLAAYFADESKASSAISADLQKKIEALLVADDEKALFARISEQRKQYLSSRDQVAKLKAAGDLDQASKIFEGTFVPVAAKYQSMVRDLLDMQRARIDATAAEIDTIGERSRNIIVVLAVLVVARSAGKPRAASSRWASCAACREARWRSG